MSKSYYFFKTDNKTGKTVHICNGDHETERECDVHFISYLYGFMDGAIELVGGIAIHVGQQSLRLKPVKITIE